MGDNPGERSGGRRSGLPVLLGIGLLAGLLMALLTIGGERIMQVVGLSPSAGGVPTPRPLAVVIGEPAPDFSAQTPQGETITLSELQGGPVAINFWATWCAPCRAEMPALQAAADAYAAEGLTVLAVNAGEPPEAVQRFMDEQGLSFPALLDEQGEVVDLYGVEFFPTTYWIDARGIVRARHLGAMTEELIDAYLSELLDVSTPAP
ncbi:MAG: TlpA disulfide reductase family protein [Anaerolineae bacterium]